MSGVAGSNISIIYVYLLNESVDVYRPVDALPVGEGVFKILEFPKFSDLDEIWEFPPGSLVTCAEEILDGERVLIARAMVRTPDAR